MKVKTRRRSAGPSGNFAPGRILEIDDAEGRKMIAAGLADAVDELPEEETTVAEPPPEKATKKAKKTTAKKTVKAAAAKASEEG